MKQEGIAGVIMVTPQQSMAAFFFFFCNLENFQFIIHLVYFISSDCPSMFFYLHL